jgi:hypothetical protein
MTEIATKPVWSATSKQAEYLAASEHFVLFGGATGGGKSEAGIVDGLGFNNPGVLTGQQQFEFGLSETPDVPPKHFRAIDFPHYQGLFLRRSMPELEDIIRRTKELYPEIGWDIGPDGKIRKPIFKEQKKTWIFPSGARILFGYVQNQGDERRYQGWEYQWIMWEELTQWPNDSAFQFLNTRLRRKASLPVRPGIRATCNPGGVGHQWVRDFWQIPDDGSPTSFAVPVKIDLGDGPMVKTLTRRFIPSKLEDNPHADQESYATMLAGQSEQTRRAMREGRWDIVDIRGMIFTDEIEFLVKNGRFRDIPYDPRFPVNTFWDLGLSDRCCVWFHQRIGGNDYFIDYEELEGVGIKGQKMLLDSKEYVYGVHFLPHDVTHKQNRHDGVITTTLDIYDDLGVRPIEVVPQIRSVQEGIEMARIVLPKCYFDSNLCAHGIKCLMNYRYKQENTGVLSRSPLHDIYSHGADAFRQFAQAYDMIDDVLANVEDTDEDIPDTVTSRSRAIKPKKKVWKV